MFTSEIYEARRARLQKTMGHGLLFFWGNNACGMNFADPLCNLKLDFFHFIKT
jgi:Xaa-Pro aminopeptidase